MSAIFRCEDRAQAGSDGVLRVHQVIVAFSLVRYFEPEALADDGVRTIRVLSATNISFFDSETIDRIEADEFDVADHPSIFVSSNGPGRTAGDTGMTLEFLDESRQRLWAVEARFDSLRVDLMADFDRDGVIDPIHPSTSEWRWGPEGQGAVLLVNSDRDTAHPNVRFRDRLDREINGPLDIEDMTRLELVVDGPGDVDLLDYSVTLHVSDAAASRIRIFDVSRPLARAVIGPGIPLASFPPRYITRGLAAEGLDYPDAGFSGLITLAADLEHDGESFGGDRCVLRVAPWLALPTTQPARRIYIAEMEDGSNHAAIRDLTAFAIDAEVPLEIVPPKVNRGDRWLQDELEIGFASRPGKTISVVLDSPRNRGLDRFPEMMLLGPDFGYVTRGNDEEASSLDSFGNLDCTPPHSGPRGEYPFGRIIFGGAHPSGGPGRRMMKVVSDFTYAQQVQHPIELYSDWLSVGHVDEFMTFIPANDAPGFRLALASPRRALELLAQLSGAGNGGALIMPGKRHERTVDDLLSDESLVAQNMDFQKMIDWNRGVLIREMGLGPRTILEIPALFYSGGERAHAYFPGMVNMQIVNRFLAVPKPFGPQADGKCVFEAEVERLTGPLGLSCRFIDTYEGYHLAQGEIHCGTNVVRTPFDAGWWRFDPGVNARQVSFRVG